MKSRRPLIAGNWKMYKTHLQASETAQALVQLIKPSTEVEVMIAPPYTALSAVAVEIDDSCVVLGAQNLYWEKEGAFTGEISPEMLVQIGCEYVIIGHSERRQYFGESETDFNKKIRAALDHRLLPVYCIGETEQEREQDKTLSVLDKQLAKGLEGFSSTDLATLVIAYEPVWAIGTGKTATSDKAQQVHSEIRRWVEKKFGNNLAKSIRILYGGSVKPDNIGKLMGMPDIDGALVGGASLDAATFSKIVQFKP